MSDRLTELQRQRALAQEQLAWIEREIARETGEQPAAMPAPFAARPVSPQSPSRTAQAAADAEAILAQYRGESASAQQNVKRGCLLYFFAALALLVLGVLAFYFLRMPHQPAA